MFCQKISKCILCDTCLFKHLNSYSKYTAHLGFCQPGILYIFESKTERVKLQTFFLINKFEELF